MNGEYQFAFYDITNTTREGFLTGVISARETEELAGTHTLLIEASPTVGMGEYGVGIFSSLQVEKWIRVTDPVDGDEKQFVIRQIDKLHQDRGVVFRLTCEHKKYALLNKIVRTVGSYVQITSATYLTLIMSGVSGFSLGTNEIPASELRNVEIENPTVMAALKYLCDTWTELSGGVEKRFYYKVSDAGIISIRREDNTGSTIPALITFDHGIKGITQMTDDSGMANRLFYSGLGNSLKFATNVSIVDSSLGSSLLAAFNLSDTFNTETYTMDDGGGNANNCAVDSYVSILLKYFTLIGDWPSGSGTVQASVKLELLDSSNNVLAYRVHQFVALTYPNRAVGVTEWVNINTGNFTNVKKIKVTTDHVIFSGGANPLFVVMQKQALAYHLSPNLDYIENAGSQTTYGVIEARVENRLHAKVINSIRNWKPSGSPTVLYDSTLSGTYTAGLADMLIATGALTAAENTDPTFIIHGTKSQKITTAVKNAGVALNIPIPNGFIGDVSYNCIFNFYIVYGQLDIRIFNRSAIPPDFSGFVFQATTQGIGFVQLVSETEFGSNTNESMQFLVKSESVGAQFYFDSVCIARSPEPIAFYKNNSADDMLLEANRLLGINKNPRVTYEADLVELRMFDDRLSTFAFDVGDSIRIIDPDTLLDSQLRVFKRDSDLLNPFDRKVVLADRSVGLGEMVSVLTTTKNLRGLS